jgi:hypothetical protein
MKRFAPLAVVVCCLSLLALPLWAAGAKKEEPKKGKTPGVEMAAMATQITGIAISPLLGVSAVGAWQYFQADTPEAKAALPWFASPSFWLIGLALVGVCAFKDTIATTLPPGWKKPLDVLETVENKVSGLVAAGAVIPSLVSLGSKLMLESAAVQDGATLNFGGLAMVHIGAADLSTLLSVLMVPLSIVVFGVVWLASHAINALILLSPWAPIDTALKAARTSLLGLVTATAWIDPVVGSFLSLIIIVIAYLVAGWAFRLTVFSTVFCWDFLTFRKKRFTPAVDHNWVFAAGKISGVPMRTYGRLVKKPDGGLKFAYCPWHLLPERSVDLPAPAQFFVGQGMFFSMVEGEDATWFFLPPRYRTHEEQLAQAHGFAGVREAGLRKAWGWIRDSLGFGRKQGAPA